MTATKKPPIGASMSYKLAAAARRAKLVATAAMLEGEIPPEAGRIRVVLSDKAISRDRQESLFGPSMIDIPEFGQARKKSR